MILLVGCRGGGGDPLAEFGFRLVTDEDTPLSVDLSANQTAAGLNYTVLTQPVNGTLEGTAPDLTYTPAENFFGTDEFTFTVDSGITDSVEGLVFILVSSVNDAPVAVDQTLDTFDGDFFPITLTATDLENDPDTFTYSIVAPPVNGYLLGTPPDLYYVSNSGFSGEDSFTFTINDSLTDSAVGTITLTVENILNRELQITHASEAQVSDHFGYSVSISGGTALVGADREDGGAGDSQTDSGAAYVFERNGTTGLWEEAAILRASDGLAGDHFGFSVSIDGGMALVGAYLEDGGPGDPQSKAGAAYVFERNGTTGLWEETAILRAQDPQPLDYFGRSVSISGETALVGANGEDGGAGSPVTNAGAAYVFDRNGTTGLWQETAILRALDPHSYDSFGISVSISGDTALVGADGEDRGTGQLDYNSGAAYVFERNSTTGVWEEVAMLQASDGQPGDLFGNSVSISGGTALVGAHLEDGGAGDPLSASGAAYVFERNAATGEWGEVAILRPSDKIDRAFFGKSVSLSGGTALVGAPKKDYTYLFKRDEATGIWSEVARLEASNRQGGDVFGRLGGDAFGSAVSVDGGVALIGAIDEDGGSGVPIDGAGAVYFFE